MVVLPSDEEEPVTSRTSPPGRRLDPDTVPRSARYASAVVGEMSRGLSGMSDDPRASRGTRPMIGIRKS